MLEFIYEKIFRDRGSVGPIPLTKHPETRGSPYLLLYVIENENIIIILTFSLGQVETMRKYSYEQNSLKLTVI